MNETSSLLDAVMRLPDGDRLAIAMAILDESPSALAGEEILREAGRRQDEIEQGLVETISYEQLREGLSARSQIHHLKP